MMRRWTAAVAALGLGLGLVGAGGCGKTDSNPPPAGGLSAEEMKANAPPQNGPGQKGQAAKAAGQRR